MKALLRLAVIGLAFGATGALAQGDYGSHGNYGSRGDSDARSSAGSSAINRSVFGARTSEVSVQATMAPAAPGDDIRNANSALWGVGG